MTSIDLSAAAARPRLLRLLGDAPLAVAGSALAAVVITLVVGRPELLYEQLVYSLSIGMLAFLIVDGARLLWWPEPGWRPRQWLSFIAVAALGAPVAHFVGAQLGGLIMGHQHRLADYLSVQRSSMVVLTFLVVSAMVGVTVQRDRLRHVRQEHANARLRAEVIERQAVQAQLRLLQAQIEPHMLFNTLANLQGLIALDPERAGRMLDQLIQYLRATLGASRSESTTLEQEFAAMQAYLGLMGVRMGERLCYEFSLPEGLRTARLPPMLLQPLVENAITHGLEPKIDGGAVAIGAEARGGLLEISVRDTGLGLGNAPVRSGGGVGVSTTRERLQAIYGTRAAVVLAPAEPEGTIVTLTLPLETTA
ncbi:sensor histidine kinase [Massilia niastensis]|uniref:sensor histidine kinase n=1 Tax=Massilia niastensis TaxID=544911 RepID=UPI00035F3417|nr:histidine kinase [Massilia niastensis]